MKFDMFSRFDTMQELLYRVVHRRRTRVINTYIRT